MGSHMSTGNPSGSKTSGDTTSSILTCAVHAGSSCISPGPSTPSTISTGIAVSLTNSNPAGQPIGPTFSTTLTTSVIHVPFPVKPNPTSTPQSSGTSNVSGPPLSIAGTSVSSGDSQITSTSVITSPSSRTLYSDSASYVPPEESVSTSQSPPTGTDVQQTMPPLPGDSTPSPITTQDGPASVSLASVPVASSSNKHSDHTGAIVGGVIGGLAFLLLVTAAAILLYRRMRARRTAPSAEFMYIARGATPGPAPASDAMRAAGTTTPSGDRLLRLEDQSEVHPPAFTPGAYGDRVLEKVQAAAAMREQYQRRDSYVAAPAVYMNEGKSEVGHEDESTEVGTEEGYGRDGDEKAGYAWAL